MPLREAVVIECKRTRGGAGLLHDGQTGRAGHQRDHETRAETAQRVHVRLKEGRNLVAAFEDDRLLSLVRARAYECHPIVRDVDGGPEQWTHPRTVEQHVSHVPLPSFGSEWPQVQSATPGFTLNVAVLPRPETRSDVGPLALRQEYM